MNNTGGEEIQIRQLLKDILPGFDDTIPDDANLFHHGMDSMKVTEFLLTIEDHFRIDFKLEDVSFDNFRSIQSVSDLVHDYVHDFESETANIQPNRSSSVIGRNRDAR